MIHFVTIRTPAQAMDALRPARPHDAVVRWTRRLIVASLVGMLLTLAATSLAAQGPATRPDSASAPRPRSIAWTSNRREFIVGDIIKVYVDEYALASANKDNSASAARQRRMNVGVNAPVLDGSPILDPIAGSVETADGGSSSQRGNATRNTRYTAEIPVRVVGITPEGLLRVQGSKLIDVDKNKQALTLSGLIRPLDVGARDVIGADNIADLQLAYQAKGSLGKPKSGIVTRIVGLLWP